MIVMRLDEDFEAADRAAPESALRRTALRQNGG